MFWAPAGTKVQDTGVVARMAAEISVLDLME
jgi:hypothetical protein